VTVTVEARPPKLYSSAVLALATELAGFPLDDSFALRGEARSRTCGSELMIGLSLASDGMIDRVGVQVRACAIGQASAALLAREARGRGAAEVAATGEALAQWLAGDGELPDWPDLVLLAPAKDHPARHGALLLPWKAASKALSSSATAG
jgi:NifU-like protein involved in Fe-S cluster formation